MRTAPRPSAIRRAFTLLEILIVVVIVSLLCLMAYRGYSVYIQRGEFAACKIKIANVGTALRGYLTDNKTWPQDSVLSADGKKPDEDVLFDWWFQILKPHGLSEDDWYCPSDMANRKKEEKMDEEENKSETGFKPAIKTPSYIPMKFEPGPFAPYDVPNFPWVIERFGHPQGMHKLMPNGSVQVEFNFKALKKGEVKSAK